MSTPGIKRGGLVHLIERRGEQEIQHDALVLAMSMEREMRGTHGEMSIDAVFVNVLVEPERRPTRRSLMVIRDVVHVSHRDWLEHRTAIAYKEAQLFLAGGGERMLQMNVNVNEEVTP